MHSSIETTPTSRTLQRALASLTHPITIGAIILLLINDHVLRILWPSWLTGKLGDVAWLAFAPIVLAALLAPFLPRRGDAVIAIAIASVGLVFALGNTIPAFLALTLRSLEWLFGVPVRLQLDPTDLLTLPALALAWYVWKRPVPLQQKHRRWGWVWLLAGAFAAMANMGMPAYGVYCIYELDEDTIAAVADIEVYHSDDGGLVWQPESSDSPEPITDAPCVVDDSWTVSISGNDLVRYRLTRGQGVDRTDDGGITWQEEITFGNTEARYAYYERFRPEAYLSSPGPFDAFYHEPSGNLVIAMGQDGVLTRTPDGTWHWVAVGPYYREEFNQLGSILRLLTGEILLGLLVGVSIASGMVALRNPRSFWVAVISILVAAVIEALLLFCAFAFFSSILELVVPVVLILAVAVVAARIARDQNPWFIVALSSTLALLLISTASAPAMTWVSTNYFSIVEFGIVGLAAIGTCFVFTIMALGERAVRLARPFLVAGTATFVMFVSSFIAWVKGLILAYYVSALIGWIAALGILILGAIYLRRHYPVQEQAEDAAEDEA